jgi:TonB family protein
MMAALLRRLSFVGLRVAAVLAIVAAGDARAQGQTPVQPEPSSPPANDDPRSGTSRGLLREEKAPPEQPAPAPVVVTPPVLKSDPGAAYPEQARAARIKDTVEVLVTVEVGSDGRVRKATVESPVGNGFDESAEAAARELVFEPARRGDKAIAARIRHKYVFPPLTTKLRGRVLAKENRKPVRATVRLVPVEGEPRTLESGEDGAWDAGDVPFGRYRVEVSAENLTPTNSEEDFAPGEVAEIVYRLDKREEKAAAALPTGEVVEEVVVRGKRPPREITRRTLEQRELSRIPGTNGDALRALQNLPGVARPPGLAGLLIVRGSSPQSTNIFIDGTLIPLAYHFGGLSSVVPTELLDRIDFYPGNFSAEYGRVSGGIVDIRVRDPKSDKVHGLAQVDLIDARVMGEGPLGKSGWNLLVAGRRSWVDAWLKPVLEATGAGVTTAPVYYDFQAVLQRNIGNTGSLRFAVYGSDDRLSILIKNVNGSAPALGGGLGLQTNFFVFQGQYKDRFGPDTEFRLMASAGTQSLNFNLGNNTFQLDSNPITSRMELSHRVSAGLTANVGMDFFYSPYDVLVRLPPPPRPGEPPPGPFGSSQPLEARDKDALYRPALYSEFELTPLKGTRIVPGIRLDYSKDTKSWDVSPRLVARQSIKPSFPRTTLKGGAGVFYQPPQPQETSPIFGIPGVKSNRSLHYGLGVEQEITRNVEISVEGFYKQLDNFVTQGLGNVATGRAYGLETLLRYKPDAKFFGWLAYTLSRSELRDAPGLVLRPANFDQTHILTVLGSYRLGRGWEIGGRFRLVSGNLVTPNSYGFFDENTGVNLARQSYPPNSERLPAFHQLDIRVDKAWKFASGTWSAYLDVLNVYNSGNVEGVSYNYNFTRRTYATGLPFLPSLGVRGEF